VLLNGGVVSQMGSSSCTLLTFAGEFGAFAREAAGRSAKPVAYGGRRRRAAERLNPPARRSSPLRLGGDASFRLPPSGGRFGPALVDRDCLCEVKGRNAIIANSLFFLDDETVVQRGGNGHVGTDLPIDSLFYSADQLPGDSGPLPHIALGQIRLDARDPQLVTNPL